MNRSRNRSGSSEQRLKKSARSVAMTQTWPVRIMVRSASQNVGALGGGDGFVEDRLELIADHDQPDAALRIGIGTGFARLLGGTVQRPRDGQRQRRRIGEEVCERRLFVGQLGQRVSLDQRRRESRRASSATDIRLEDRAPPSDHVLHHPRAREDRQHAGLHQRGFPHPAHAGDHEEAVPGRGAPAQHVDQLGDQAGAAAIDQRMLEIERLAGRGTASPSTAAAWFRRLLGGS